MSHRFKLAFLVLALSLESGVVNAADDPVATCDALAGSPLDLDLPDDVEGTSFDALDPSEEVEAACLAASDAHPASRRFFAHLGRIYAKRGQHATAVDAYRRAHGRGSAVAANNLGAMYMQGEGVVANQERSTQLIRQAAHRGLTFAMGTMAVRAREGQGMTANQWTSFYWYQRAHEAGDAVATNDLAVMYQKGYGVRENDERALSLFSEALERDPATGIAAYNIARAYEDGEGVEANLSWARGYYVTAFDAGYADAAYDLGRFHAEGLEVARDAGRAAAWYQAGTDLGSFSATIGLADAYLEGAGVEQDAGEAQSLYLAALDLDPDDGWRAYINERLDAVSGLEARGDRQN